ncbi:MAG: RNA methyltransferase [Candidatus Hadarchaeota archaeon]
MKPETFVLLPASLASDSYELSQKTIKVGMVGRALAIFQVDKVCIYSDDEPQVRNQEKEKKLITILLNYMETPQYLRKILFPVKEELRYAGLLPPLRTPHHPLGGEKNRPGDYREGAVINIGKKSLVEIGLPTKGITDAKVRLRQRLSLRLGERAEEFIPVTPVRKGEIPEYWGYEVLEAKSLADGLDLLKPELKVGTSRLGQNLYELEKSIKGERARSVAVAFGGPYAGLQKICERQGTSVEGIFDLVVNTVPDQGTVTVRAEEALVATLSLLNTFRRK